MKEELFEEYLKDQIRIRDKELDKFRPFKSAYEMKKEIERLNNIINEIEKYCNELIIYKPIVTKIKELKGDDKK